MYRSAENYRHEGDKLGILLANLGTPAEPTAKALRPYLRRFLNDLRVIENKSLWWKFLLNCIIIPLRAPKSAAAYASIWGEDGRSPLDSISNKIADGIRTKLQADADAGDLVALELGMSYSKPDLAEALAKLRAQNITKLVVLPLYPQYSGSTVASVFDAVARELGTWRLVPDLRFISCYHDNPAYVSALAKSVSDYRRKHGKSQVLVFSFHGMPLSSLLNGDPYHCQCHKTARLVAEELKLKSDEYRVCFQSRFGKAKWLQPYTDESLRELAQQGVKDVQVICPAFAADCVETLEEIKIEAAEIFAEAGGKSFGYVPCLNDSKEHINLLAGLILDNASAMLDAAGKSSASLGEQKARIQDLAKQDHYVL